MLANDHLLIFNCAHLMLAIALAPVERVIRAVKVTTVPNAPAIVHGVINIHGEIVPVINLRARLGLPLKQVVPDDRFVIISLPKQRFAFVADEVSEIDRFRMDDFTRSEELVAGIEADGVLKRNDGLVLIYDLEKFFPLYDAHALAAIFNPPKAG